MHNLFSTSAKHCAASRAAWTSISSREFYEGELEADDFDSAELVFDKSLAYPIALTRLACRAPLAYRRSWQHIRSNKVGLRVIWFVRRGSLKIARSQGTTMIAAGEAGIVDSNLPFHAKLLCDATDNHESFQAIVPAHLFMTHLSHAEGFTGTFSLTSPEGRLVERLLDVLMDQGDELNRPLAEPLANGFLQAISESLSTQKLNPPRRQKLFDKRLADIENYILMNLTDPDLCYDKVAASCGISPRYLCYLLKANNTSFSDLVWKNRLPQARDWLTAPAMRDYPIHEIAFMSGFKSAAHFSRMFKANYGCPPREYRAAHGISDPAANAASEVHDLGAELLAA